MTLRRGVRSAVGPPAAGLLLLVPFLMTGCGLLFQDPEAGSAPVPAAERSAQPSAERPGAEPADPPIDTTRSGSLRQSEISMYLRRGDLQLRVTPLAGDIIRTTAPDTHERLEALASGHQAIFQDQMGATAAFQLFLVAVHSESVETAFEPEDLNMVSRGLRYRPLAIRPVTPRWSRHRVAPRETLMAIYAFPAELDLESGGLEVEYREVRDRSWERIFPRIQVERGRSGG
ncbi:MAG: hypothetical protein EA422_04270 [Gemmatimonadales bacterium]|nr:MAG: hypothetical protein EA422_04270 [Gemmatimonadales bacterium]